MTSVSEQLTELRNEMLTRLSDLSMTVSSMHDIVIVDKHMREEVVTRLDKLQEVLNNLGAPKVSKPKVASNTQPVKSSTYAGPTQYFKAQYVLEKTGDGNSTPLLDALNSMTRVNTDIVEYTLNKDAHKVKIEAKAEGKLRYNAEVTAMWSEMSPSEKDIIKTLMTEYNTNVSSGTTDAGSVECDDITADVHADDVESDEDNAKPTNVSKPDKVKLSSKSKSDKSDKPKKNNKPNKSSKVVNVSSNVDANANGSADEDANSSDADNSDTVKKSITLSKSTKTIKHNKADKVESDNASDDDNVVKKVKPMPKKPTKAKA